MPARYLMSWEGQRRRWWKMYGWEGTGPDRKRRRFVVSCRQLGLPEHLWTKEGSYQEANRWWEAKRRELEASTNPLDRINFDDTSWKLDPDMLPRVEAHERARAQELGDWTFYNAITQPLQYDAEGMPRLPSPAPPPQFRPPSDLSMSHQLDRWLSSQRARARAHEITDAEAANLTYYTRPFLDFIGPSALVTSINEERWHAFYDHLLASIADGTWSKVYAQKLFRYARAFLAYLASLNLIPAPRNLNDRSFKFRLKAQAIRVFTKKEIHRLLLKAQGQMRLHILLALNTGMTQQDLSDLHPSEVHWQRQTITRKRSKGDHHDSVPTVSYPLWPETFALLKKYRSDNLTHVLLTSSGGLWVDKSGCVKDCVRTNFTRLLDRLDLSGSFKILRKTGASALQAISNSDMATLYLGHAPASVKDRHYVQPDEGAFFDAVRRLRVELGIAKLELEVSS